jgi:hypothetical protein
MTRPKDLFEAASYDLNKFRERRMAERRSVPRDTADRRVAQTMQPPQPSSPNHGDSGGNGK